MLAKPSGDGRERDVHSPADDDVVEPAEHLQTAVVVETTRVVGEVPPVDEDLGREPRIAVVAVEDRGTAQPDASVRPQCERHAVERHPVVDAATRGLRRSVGRHDADPRGLGPRAQRWIDGASAEQDGVEAGESPRLGPVLEQSVQLGRHEGREERGVAVSLEARQGRLEAEVLHHHRLVAGHQGPHDHLDPGDVRRRQRKQPAATGPQPSCTRLDARQDGVPREQDALGGPGRAGRLDEQPRRAPRVEPLAQLDDGMAGFVGDAQEAHAGQR